MSARAPRRRGSGAQKLWGAEARGPSASESAEALGRAGPKALRLEGAEALTLTQGEGALVSASVPDFRVRAWLNKPQYRYQ